MLCSLEWMIFATGEVTVLEKVIDFANSQNVSKEEVLRRIQAKLWKLVYEKDFSGIDTMVAHCIVSREYIGDEMIHILSRVCANENCPKRDIEGYKRVSEFVGAEKRNPAQKYWILLLVNLGQYLKSRTFTLSQEQQKRVRALQEAHLCHGCLDLFKVSMGFLIPDESLVTLAYRFYSACNWNEGINIVHGLTGISPYEIVPKERLQFDGKVQKGSLTHGINRALIDAFGPESEAEDSAEVTVICKEIFDYISK